MGQRLKFFSVFISFFFLFCFYIFLYQIYSPRVNAFGCFDDCFNYLAGYFLLKGKTLYSEIFFNHQPLMAYLSYFIQRLTQPINIYELVLRHRQAVFGFGFLMNLLIGWRFWLAGLGFALFYETTKFYLFGDRFLAEGLIVYPLVYLTGLVWFKYQKRKIYPLEYFLTAFFVWLVVFMRLPFISLAVVIFWLIVGGIKEIGEIRGKKGAVLVLGGLVLATLIFLPISEYFFNVFTVNLKMGQAVEVDLLKSFLYPLYLFFGGEKNLFRNFLVGMDVIFLLLLFWRFTKKTKLTGIMILLLGLANLRPVEPGRIFYDAFHLLPWYGMLVFLTLLMLGDFFSPPPRRAVYPERSRMVHLGGVFSWLARLNILKKFLAGFLALLFFSFIFSPQFFPREKIDPHEEFLTHFGHQLQVGEVVKSLSKPSDTLFLDGFDDLIYWQADRLSSYPYSWYTSVMPHIPKYADVRLGMFANNPPDFYYGSCPGHEEIAFWNVPGEFKKDYQRLYSEGKPTCLHVRKEKIPEISEEKWQKAKEWLYELPEN